MSLWISISLFVICLARIKSGRTKKEIGSAINLITCVLKTLAHGWSWSLRMKYVNAYLLKNLKNSFHRPLEEKSVLYCNSIYRKNKNKIKMSLNIWRIVPSEKSCYEQVLLSIFLYLLNQSACSRIMANI